MSERNDKNDLLITTALIEKYYRGQLDGKTMHAIERQALDDPLLAEAMEGYALQNPDQSLQLDELSQRLKARISGQSGTTQAPLTPPSRISHQQVLWLAAAACFLLLISIGGIFLTARYSLPDARLAQQKEPAQVPVPFVLKDTPAHSTLMKQPQSDTFRPEDLAVNRSRGRAPSRELKKSISPERKKNTAIIGPIGEKPHPDTQQGAGYAVRRGEQMKEGAIARQKKENTLAKNSTFKKTVPQPDYNRGAVRKIPGYDSILLTGVVRDADNARPLRGVTVRVSDDSLGAVSDTSGNFRLSLAAKPESLSIAFIGYQPEKIAMIPGNGNLDIRLHPSSKGLDETVAVGYGVKRNALPSMDAHPSVGFPAFGQYLQDSLRYPPEAARQNIVGTVELSFWVMGDGTPRRIKIVDGLNRDCNEEAIRLLRDGPKWTPAPGGKPSPQKITVVFKLENETN